jgi:ATP-grasp domain-containing protein
MNPLTVWLNKNLENTWEVIRILCAARLPGELHVLCTHPNRNYPGRREADLFEQEPDGLASEAYVDYCLDVVRRHRVDLFVPGRNLLPIVRARSRFEALGARVLAAADAATLELLASKARAYSAIGGDIVRIPDYEVVNDLAGFDAAWARLRPLHEAICYKPAVSIYGLGFRIVGDRGAALERLRSGDRLLIGLDDARRAFAARGRFRDLLVMQYLPGPERSVDCLARDGVLVRCVVRRKEEGGQVIEDNPGAAEVARRLTARLGLTGLFNVQLRDDHGVTYLLEINLRMSGGLPYACQSGLALPCWAVRLALGTAAPEDVPPPRTDVWVPVIEPALSA